MLYECGVLTTIKAVALILFCTASACKHQPKFILSDAYDNTKHLRALFSTMDGVLHTRTHTLHCRQRGECQKGTEILLTENQNVYKKYTL